MPLTFGIRPEHIQIAFDGVDGVPATVEFSEYLGSTCYIYCRLAEGQAVTLESRGDLQPAGGDQIKLVFPPERSFLFDGRGMRVR